MIALFILGLIAAEVCLVAVAVLVGVPWYVPVVSFLTSFFMVTMIRVASR